MRGEKPASFVFVDPSKTAPCIGGKRGYKVPYCFRDDYKPKTHKKPLRGRPRKMPYEDIEPWFVLGFSCVMISKWLDVSVRTVVRAKAKYTEKGLTPQIDEDWCEQIYKRVKYNGKNVQK